MVITKGELADDFVACPQRVEEALRAGDTRDGGNPLVGGRQNPMQREQRKIPRRHTERLLHANPPGELLRFSGAAMRQHCVGCPRRGEGLTQPADGSSFSARSADDSTSRSICSLQPRVLKPIVQDQHRRSKRSIAA